MNVVDQIRLFVEPESVALIGAPRDTESGVNTVQFMLEYGFKGRLYPVNPSADSIVGVKAYPTVGAITGPVDLAVISVPRHIVPGVVDECIQKGIKAITVVTQGFGDADEEGRALQEKIVTMSRAAGVRIVGPNSMGTVNAQWGLSTCFAQMDRPERTYPASFAGQSGLVINLGVIGSQFNSYRFLGKAIDLGNTCDVDFADVLEYFEEDPNTQVIALHIEGIKDGRRFLEVARRVARKKPVVALKMGRTPQGSQAVASHTGALVGDDEIYQAAFDEAGIIRVNDLEELEDVVKGFFTVPLPQGNRVAIVTMVGGIGVMAADACGAHGLEAAQLSPDTLSRLEPLFPDWFPPGNPVDIWPGCYANPFKTVYNAALDAVGADLGVDAIVGVVWLPEMDRFHIFDVSGELAETATKFPDKPVLAFPYGPDRWRCIAKVDEDGRVAAYPAIERCMRTLGAMWRYRQLLDRQPLGEPVELPANRATGRAILAAAGRMGRPRLDAEGFDLLDAYGIETLPSRMAGDEDEAVAAAESIGFPVALKAISPQISHKSDAGGVHLGIASAADLRTSYVAMMAAVARKAPGAKVDGVLVQRMASGGQELILGIKRDPQFGPVAVFGAGGLYAEVMKDIAFGTCPLTSERAREMVKSTRVYRLLCGLREAPRDVDAVVEALLRLSQLAVDLPQVCELDINPLLVMEQGCVAADVRVILQPE